MRAFRWVVLPTLIHAVFTAAFWLLVIYKQPELTNAPLEAAVIVPVYTAIVGYLYLRRYRRRFSSPRHTTTW